MKIKILALLLLNLTIFSTIYSKNQNDHSGTLIANEEIYKIVESSFDEADIPGLSMIFVTEDNVTIRNWGYADKKNKILVDKNTLFELGSLAKAYTALAVHQLEKEGMIDLSSNISKYIPWFKAYYNSSEKEIKVSELLHHTSGISTEMIAKIPEGESDDMLEMTIKSFNNIDLNSIPGTNYEYATINYDILGYIIEKVSGLSFEAYLKKNIFEKLHLRNTYVGVPANTNISKGYKISYFSPREYNAPRFKGNEPAGYIISNAIDMAKWLKYQMAIESNELSELIERSHFSDLSVSPHGEYSYASGWHVTPYKEQMIFHDGLNPNFTSFIGFLPNKKTGIILLANSNSPYTSHWGNIILKTLNGEDISEIPEPENVLDKTFSMVSIILSLFLLGIVALLAWLVKGIISKERKIKIPNAKIILKIIGNASLTIPFVIAVYMLPKALSGFTWDSIVVWTPKSFYVGCALFASSVIGVWAINTISILIPTKNKYYRSLPIILVLSLMTGLANMVIILILINAVGVETRLEYILFYFLLTLVFYIAGRKIVQTKLINISVSIVYELRVKLINKIFLSSYQKFEKIDNGRVIATLNEDTATISNSVNIFIALISNIITIIGVFIYLGTISFVATLFILTVIFLVATLYFFVSKQTNILFEQARDTANTFSGLIDGLLYGYKELSLSGDKKKEYSNEVEVACSELKNKSGKALIKFVNAFLVGETLLIVVLGSVCFLIPQLFPEIPNYKLLGIIMIVLYLIGPINAILNSIPNLMRIKVSWNRIKQFSNEINPDLKVLKSLKERNKNLHIEKISTKEMVFEYKNSDEDRKFRVGPINLEINSGELIFIIGGNGSGKSTFANLLTGLYKPDSGFIEVNGKRVAHNELGELYSTIFSNHHIFKKLYGVDLKNKKEELDVLLKMLRLEDKVSIVNGEFSTIDLSNGQKKRLSLMKCFIENSQIYLFDEWAADQDPEYKKIFYRELLPEMKEQGKIVIAITHDDNYFDVADRIVKMDAGKLIQLKTVEKLAL